MGKRWNRRRVGKRWGVSASAGAAQGITGNAGNDVQTTSSSNQALSGSVSNGTAASWAWALQTKPAGSSASISNATSQNATLTGIDNNGAYVARLTVTDGNGFTDTSYKTVDYSGGATTGGWADVCNITFANESNVTLNDGAETTINGRVFWTEGFVAGSSVAVVNGTGLVVSFPNQNGQFSVVLFKGTGISKVNGDWPRLRVIASFDDIVYSANSDAVGVWWCGQPFVQQQRSPQAKFQYKRNNASTNVWKAGVRKGTLGSNGSSLSASDVATDEADSAVMEIREGSNGTLKYCADSGTLSCGAAGSVTVRASALQPHTLITDSDQDYWAEGANLDGPYLGVMFRSNSNGSQACIVKQIVVQKYV